jgi:Mn-containing catalase
MMSFDLSKVVEQMGDGMIEQIGSPLGLNADQSKRVARALGQRFSSNREQTIQAAAADTGLDEEVVGSMLNKLVDEGKQRVLESGPVADAISGAKTQAQDAMAAMGGEAMKSASGLLGGFFGKK